MRNLMGIIAMLFGVASAQPAIAETENLVVIDVRTPEEYSSSHVQNSINIDFYSKQFMAEINKLDKSKTYKVYCRSGNRSGQSEKIMKTLGFKDVENIGSLNNAAKRLNRTCEGKENKC